MKVLWKIERLDGSTMDVMTDETEAPIPGDGKILEEIPVKIGGNVTTPVTSPITGYDMVVAAKEQDA